MSRLIKEYDVGHETAAAVLAYLNPFDQIFILHICIIYIPLLKLVYQIFREFSIWNYIIFKIIVFSCKIHTLLKKIVESFQTNFPMGEDCQCLCCSYPRQKSNEKISYRYISQKSRLIKSMFISIQSMFSYPLNSYSKTTIRFTPTENFCETKTFCI